MFFQLDSILFLTRVTTTLILKLNLISVLIYFVYAKKENEINALFFILLVPARFAPTFICKPCFLSTFVFFFKKKHYIILFNTTKNSF